jgi:hypothetical protein
MVHARSSEETAVDLACAGRVVARYVWAPDLPRAVSPRPYLHPVTTLGGTVVTGFRPADHPHHLGASIAVAVLNDVNFWGGRTYLRDRGPVVLDNHGTQRHSRWLHRSRGRLAHELLWTDREGAPVAREERTIEARAVTDGAWLLRVGFTLAGLNGSGLTIDSPGARGRAGAGYGGFFWRAPAGSQRVRVFGAGDAPGAPGTASAGGAGPGAGADGAGAPSAPSTVHGSRRPWVALTGRQPDGPRWTLAFLADGGHPPDPWFVRSDDYAGVCSAVAWDRPVVVDGGHCLERGVGVLVADGAMSAATVEAAVAASREASR